MAEIDVSRADGVILFNGEPVADVRKGVAHSTLAAFFDLAEGREPPDAEGLRDDLSGAEEEIERLEGKLEAIKDLLSE